jgi:anti-sigma-K factor RskA
VSAAHEPFAELAAGYALGALDPRDAAAFERHLAERCAECEEALRGYREALARVAADEREAPPPHVRAALLGRIAPAPPPRRSRPVRLVVAWAATAALAAGIAAVVTASAVGARYEARIAAIAREADALRAELAVQTRTVADLQRKVDEQDHALTMVRAESAEQARTLALLGDPATRVVTLAGAKPSPNAQGRMLWNPQAGGLFVAAALPPAPAGKIYELWAIAAGKPRAAGTFSVDPDGRGRVRVEPIAGVAAVDVFAVTLEPAPGGTSPTGEIYLASKEA